MMKVVWLCTFWNDYKRRHVGRWRTYGREEIGQWIPNLLQAFYGDSTYEIHVITVDLYMRKLYVTWSDENIVYHCFQPLLPFLGASPKVPLDSLTGFRWNRFRIKKLITKIRPDVVHLFGVENPNYGAVVLDLPMAAPILCTIQGFVSRELSVADGIRNRVRAKYEGLLMKRIFHYLGDYDSRHYIEKFNREIDYGYMYFPVNEGLIGKIPPQAIEYDVLFAGAQTRAKGFDDFLKLVAECVARYPAFKAAVVGTVGAHPGTREFLEEHNISSAIVWLGRYPTQEGLFSAYRRARLFLAPTYNDAFPSTIRENMLLGVPCIAYATGGIPCVNADDEKPVVSVVPQGDVAAMVEKVLYYIKNDSVRREMACRAKTYAEQTFSLEANGSVIKRAYERIA